MQHRCILALRAPAGIPRSCVLGTQIQPLYRTRYDVNPIHLPQLAIAMSCRKNDLTNKTIIIIITIIVLQIIIINEVIVIVLIIFIIIVITISFDGSSINVFCVCSSANSEFLGRASSCLLVQP